MLGAAGKQNEGGKMKLLPFTIAASFIQLHNMSLGGQMLRTLERKTEEGEKPMKAVRKTDKGSFLMCKKIAGIKRCNGDSNMTADGYQIDDKSSQN